MDSQEYSGEFVPDNTDNPRAMYGGWFAPEQPNITNDIPQMFERARTALEDLYMQCVTSGELPHTLSVTAYCDERVLGHDLRLIATGEGDAEDEALADEIPEEFRAFVSDEVNRLLTERTLPNWPVYFMDGKWLVTYDWVLSEKQELTRSIAELHQRLFEIEQRPNPTMRNAVINAAIAGLVVVLVYALAGLVTTWLQ